MFIDIVTDVYIDKMERTKQQTAPRTYMIDDDTKRVINLTCSTPALGNANKSYRCMWCTLAVEGQPIGCPVDVVKAVRRAKQVEVTPTSSYQTIGIFCCFNCAKAYASDRSRDPTFKNSARLLAAMYVDQFGQQRGKEVTLRPSPPITLMAAYGGDMTDERYRSLIDRKTFVDKGFVKMFPVTTVYEDVETVS